MSKEYKKIWRKRKAEEQAILNCSSSSDLLYEGDREASASISCHIEVENSVNIESNSSGDVEDVDILSESSVPTELPEESLSESNSNTESMLVDESEEENLEKRLWKNLANWASLNNITRTALTDLLKILKNNNIDNLPADARTLLKTPRRVAVTAKCGGDYFYRGIVKSLESRLKNIEGGMLLNLNINIDGCPLFKSSGVSIWPILGHFAGFNAESPFIIALYCGKAKPSDIEEFLEDFINEYCNLKENGFQLDGRQYYVKINAVLCDAPARQLVKMIKAHNAHYGCERCVVEGISIEKRMIFESTNSELRTKENFNQRLYENHQLGLSPLIQTGIDCVQDFPLDYMHLVLLGVTKRLLKYLKEGPRVCKLSQHQIKQISDHLRYYIGKIPSEFARQPRGLEELSRWKATELRHFLLYTGPIVLKNILDADHYNHFLCLSLAMRIILTVDRAFRTKYLDYASQLLIYFVEASPNFYGKTFCVYNVHNLVHLCDDSRYFDESLSKVSCFPFENFMQVLKRHVRKPFNPIAQIIKHESEITQQSVQKINKSIVTKIGSNCKDSWFIVAPCKIVKIYKKDGDQHWCYLYEGGRITPYFTNPCNSVKLKIFLIESFQVKRFTRKVYYKADFVEKMCCFHLQSGDLVLVSMLSGIL